MNKRLFGMWCSGVLFGALGYRVLTRPTHLMLKEHYDQLSDHYDQSIARDQTLRDQLDNAHLMEQWRSSRP